MCFSIVSSSVLFILARFMHEADHRAIKDGSSHKTNLVSRG